MVTIIHLSGNLLFLTDACEKGRLELSSLGLETLARGIFYTVLFGLVL